MKIRLSILLLILYLPVQSQIINNRLLLSVNFELVSPMGSAENSINNGVFPKLFSNMGISPGGNIKGVYLFHGNLGAGMSVGANYLRGWSYEDKDYYTGATAFIIYASPVIYYQTQSLMNNRMRFFFDAGPVLASTSVKLENEVIFINNTADKPVTHILSTTNPGAGFNVSGGLRFNLNSKTALSVNCAYRYFTTSSVLYPDEAISSLSYGLGITILFLKDKKYYF